MPWAARASATSLSWPAVARVTSWASSASAGSSRTRAGSGEGIVKTDIWPVSGLSRGSFRALAARLRASALTAPGRTSLTWVPGPRQMVA